MADHLTANFTLEEFAKTRHKAYRRENLEAAREKRSKLLLVALLLQRVRDHFGVPIVVSSGIRSKALNDYLIRIGRPASPTSQHMLAEAVDFKVPGVPLVEVFDWIRLESGLEYGQLILEGEPASWIHLSVRGTRPEHKCQQAIRWTKAEGYKAVA